MFVNEMLDALSPTGLLAAPRIQDSTAGPMAIVEVNEAVKVLLQGLTPGPHRGRRLPPPGLESTSSDASGGCISA